MASSVSKYPGGLLVCGQISTFYITRARSTPQPSSSQTTILPKYVLKLRVAGWEHNQGTLEIQLFFDLLLFNQGSLLRDILVEPLC